MLKLDFDNNRGPMAILTLVTVLNIGLVISFLAAYIGGVGLVLNSIHVYALVGLELAGVIFAYVVSKRRNATVAF